MDTNICIRSGSSRIHQQCKTKSHSQYLLVYGLELQLKFFFPVLLLSKYPQSKIVSIFYYMIVNTKANYTPTSDPAINVEDPEIMHTFSIGILYTEPGIESMNQK